MATKLAEAIARITDTDFYHDFDDGELTLNYVDNGFHSTLVLKFNSDESMFYVYERIYRLRGKRPVKYYEKRYMRYDIGYAPQIRDLLSLQIDYLTPIAIPGVKNARSLCDVKIMTTNAAADDE